MILYDEHEKCTALLFQYIFKRYLHNERMKNVRSKRLFSCKPLMVISIKDNKTASTA